MNKKIQEITEKFRDFPGISLKLAERMAISIIENPELKNNISDISFLSKDLSKDYLTGLIIDKEEIPNEKKEKDVLLIIESNKDVKNILEKTKTTKSIFILDIQNKRDFNSTKKVLERLFKIVDDYKTKEILFLLTPSIESELIMRVVKEEISKLNKKSIPKLTRLSMGIPFGGSIEFSDERTIKEAMSKREEA